MLGGRPSKPGLLQTFLLMRLDTGNLQYKPNILVYIISRFWKVLPSYLKLLITTNKSISTNFCKNFLTYFIGCSVCHFKTEDLRGTLLRDIKLPRSWSSGKPRYPGFLWSKVHISTEKLPLLFWKIFQLYLLWNFHIADLGDQGKCLLSHLKWTLSAKEFRHFSLGKRLDVLRTQIQLYLSWLKL